MSELIQLPALGPGGQYLARNRVRIDDVSGAPVAELSLVPPVYVARAMTALRRATSLEADARVAALTRAAELFATAELGGLSAEEYLHTTSRVSGMPISVVRAAMMGTAMAARSAYRTAQLGRPVGALGDLRDPHTRTGAAVWTRRGSVFAVHAAGNHPGVHALWLEALALGYRVAVRPSRREPFTPHRLVAALRAAGFADNQVMLLPTDHAGADGILRDADLGMVYGGAEVIAKYAADPRVLPQGPGRSKMLLTADVDWRDYLDTIVSSVSGQAGTACVCTTGVLVEGDPAPLAEALAERLAALPSLPPQDERAVLPVATAASAKALEQHLASRATGTVAWLGGAGIADDLGDGSAVLRPSVHQVERADAPQIAAELPYPCVWVAPWTRADGVAALRDTLVLTVATRDDALVEALLDEPSVTNVYVGNHPTHWIDTGIPHDGYLSEFLMRTKAVIRD